MKGAAPWSGRMFAVAAALLATTFALLDVANADGWTVGRATHYSGPNDAWSIHDGSCQYYYLDPNVATGWDVAAPSDMNPDYPNSCGKCYEVGCAPMNLKDGYGNKLDRSSVCYDPDATLVIMITDTCPCYYPANLYSNKRWCCGDMIHYDMSVYAFERLADPKFGVIGIKFRPVPCDYVPPKPACLPSGKTASGADRQPPAGWAPSKDKRPKINRGPAKCSAHATTTTSSSSSPSSSPSQSNTPAVSSSGSSGSSSYSSGGVKNIYFGGLMQGWADASYSAKKWTTQQSTGPNGRSAYCSTVSPGGAVSFLGSPNAFAGTKVLQFWVKSNDVGVPNFAVQLTSTKGGCRDLQLQGISYAEKKGDWMRFGIALNAFDWRAPTWSDGAAFWGCSSQLAAGDVTTVSFKNSRSWDQWICVDEMNSF